MPFRKSSSMDSTGIGRGAERWGKVVARRVEEVGPDFELEADQIEQFAKGAACAVAPSLGPQRLDRVHHCGASRGVDSEDQTDRQGDDEGHHRRLGSNHRRDTREP